MNPPVEHVRVSVKGKEILKRLKGRLGIEHWNEICRIAFCVSLANPSPISQKGTQDSAIDMDWKTFAGQYHLELAALTKLRAYKAGLDIENKEIIGIFFRNHLERGITSIGGIKNIPHLLEALFESDGKI